MSATDVASAISEVQAVADLILKLIETDVPPVAGEAAVSQAVLDEIALLLEKALTAYAAASGTPITVDTVMALAPNSTPLSAPDGV